MKTLNAKKWSSSPLKSAVLAVALMLTACNDRQPIGKPASAGSLAFSNDGKLLYAADTDNGVLIAVDLATRQKVAQVKVGEGAAVVVVGADETIYVSNRQSRSVSVIREGEWVEAARLAVGIEPGGMSLAPDGSTIYVVSAVSLTNPQQGLLSAFDTATLKLKWQNDTVGREPSGLVLVDAGKKALVSLSRDGEVSEVDVISGKTLRRGDASAQGDVYSLANASRNRSTSTATFKAHAAASLVANPDGSQVFMPVTWSRESVIGLRPSRTVPYYQAGGPCSVGAVTSAGIVTYTTGNGVVTPKVDDLTACGSRGVNASGNDQDFPSSALVTSRARGNNDGALQGPTVGVVDSSGSWLYLVNRDTRNLVVMPTNRRSGTDVRTQSIGASIRTSVEGLGHGADGIGIDAAGTTLYVYNQFDHSLQMIVAEGRGDDATLVLSGSPIRLSDDTLTAYEATGRKLFYDANDARISGAMVSVSCNSCHTNGLDDSHVWGFPDGPRQTPVLAGRKMLETAPYHWSGEFKSMTEFNEHTIIERMGGSGLDKTSALNLDAFVAQLPSPQNPLRDSMTSDALTKGRAAFAKAGCDGCHAGELMTDNKNAQVGTLRGKGSAMVDTGLVVTNGFNVPSLLGIGRSAPYLHDGSEATLEQRVFGNTGDVHGQTSSLSDAEKGDLVTYLKSL
jgi:predicted small secreted protein